MKEGRILQCALLVYIKEKADTRTGICFLMRI